MTADNLPTAYKFFETLLENAIARGEVKAEIDIKMFAYVIASMNVVFVEYHSESVSEAIDESMIETVEKYVDFLKSGIVEHNQKVRMQRFLP